MKPSTRELVRPLTGLGVQNRPGSQLQVQRGEVGTLRTDVAQRRLLGYVMQGCKLAAPVTKMMLIFALFSHLDCVLF